MNHLHANSLGDMASRLFVLKWMFMALKTKLGVVPDLWGMKENTANTSLEFHAGDAAERYVAAADDDDDGKITMTMMMMAMMTLLMLSLLLSSSTHVVVPFRAPLLHCRHPVFSV